MTLRSKDNTETIRTFDGINDLIDDVKLPEGLVHRSFGGFFNERKEFERLPGHLAVSTSSSLGSVLTIKQLVFDNTDFVVYHSSNQLVKVDDLSSLRTTNTSTLPWNRFIP